MKEYPPHPYAAIFPLRGGASLIELSDSIAAIGQIEEIVLLDRQVIDGRRRQAAAIRAGRQPRYRDFGSRPSDGSDPLEFSFAVNYHRRDDLSEAEKVLAAVGYARFKRGENQFTVGNSSDTTEVGPPPSQQEAAKKFGVGVKQIERAKAVMEHGTPELQEAMRTELVSVTDAASIAKEPPEVQRAALEKVRAKEAKTLAAAVAGMRPAIEDAGKIGKELSQLIERLQRVETAQAAARDLAVSGLRTALALIGKL